MIAAIATALDEAGEPHCARSIALARVPLDHGCDGLFAVIAAIMRATAAQPIPIAAAKCAAIVAGYQAVRGKRAA